MLVNWQNRQKRILMVDDHPESILLLRRFLRKSGHLITTVCDGYEAINRLSNESFDLLIIDWLMPGLGGRQTLLDADRDLSLDSITNEKWQHNLKIPVVVYSAESPDPKRIKELAHFRIVNVYNKVQKIDWVGEKISQCLDGNDLVV